MSTVLIWLGEDSEEGKTVHAYTYMNFSNGASPRVNTLRNDRLNGLLESTTKAMQVYDDQCYINQLQFEYSLYKVRHPNFRNAERLIFLNLDINLVDKASCYPLIPPCLILDTGQTSSILVQKKHPAISLLLL